jgi:hypothetical protein
MGCINGKCANYHTVAADGNCTTDQQCSACLGCSQASKTCAVYSKDVVYGIDCQNETDATTCKVGYAKCACDGANYKCIEQLPVYSIGGCETQFKAWETCLNSSGCNEFLAPFGSKSLSFFSWQFLKIHPKGCAAQKCMAESNCIIKCTYDQYVQYFGQPAAPKCGASAFTAPSCATATGCPLPAPPSSTVPSTVSSAAGSGSGAASGSGSGAASGSGSGAASGSGSAKSSAASASGSGAASGSGSAKSSAASASGSGAASTTTTDVPSNTDFGMVLIVPLLSLVSMLLF